MDFKLVSPFKPAGGQDKAIEELYSKAKDGAVQTLLGITGSGKTFVMANLIQKLQRPTLILAHNKILAAQLYTELKEFFPENAVEYFISYFDFYQPESYLPTTDLYIEKDSEVNEQIEKMRLKTTSNLMHRKDVIVVASISCIYGIGNPEDFENLSLQVKTGETITRNEIINKLIEMQYERNDDVIQEGRFRVRGDSISVFPSYSDSIIKIELFGEKVERILDTHKITGETLEKLNDAYIYPAKQFAIPPEKQKAAISTIKQELKETLPNLKALEAQRLSQRVNYDIEMLEQLGYCNGIENYSRHFDKRKPGQPPFVLLDYFPKDFLFIIDESHQTIPQARAMYHGDFTRKKNLVDYGFRLPSAYDNRPLKFEEFEKYLTNAVFVSATPADYEIERSSQVVELIIRPTGLLDPTVEVRPIKGHIQDLLTEIRATTQKANRTLVTTLTKKMAEDLTEFLAREEIKVRYMHSDIDSLDRIELIRQLRSGDFDVLVGINLLREGLDIPEVELVAILDADKEGYLRNERSLIQTIGRASRNSEGKVILYADIMTNSVIGAVQKTMKRREEQITYNNLHKITPMTIKKAVHSRTREVKGTMHMSKSDVQKKIVDLEAEMKLAAENLDFERAIDLRESIKELSRQ